MYFIYYSRSKETCICKHYLIRKKIWHTLLLELSHIDYIICSRVLYKLLLCISLYNVTLNSLIVVLYLITRYMYM